MEELNKALTATKQRAQASPDAKRAKESAKEIEILKREITRLKKNAANNAQPSLADSSPPRLDPVIVQRAEDAERNAQQALEDLEAERRARSDEAQDNEAAISALKQQLQILGRQKEQGDSTVARLEA